MKTILLTRGFSTVVDDDLFEWLNSFNWYASGPSLLVRPARRDSANGRRLIYIYHQILGVFPWNMEGEVDHINRNALDNRRENLRIVSHAENMQNGIRALKSVGVSIDRTHGTFKAYINERKKYGTFRRNVGTFKTREEALLALKSYQ